jgi:hypothetical protein
MVVGHSTCPDTSRKSLLNKKLFQKLVPLIRAGLKRVSGGKQPKQESRKKQRQPTLDRNLI